MFAVVSPMVRVSGIPPARTQFTRTPAGPNSVAKVRLSASTAPQTAVIPDMYGMNCPVRLAKRNTMAPRPRGNMCRAAAREMRNCEPTIRVRGNANRSHEMVVDGVA